MLDIILKINVKEVIAFEMRLNWACSCFGGVVYWTHVDF